MTGATAGTAILKVPNEETEDLRVVTLTINNSCNLACDHCYLQYDGARNTLSEADAQRILDANFNLLTIVGKEPTLHPNIVQRLASENKARERVTGMITNGTLLSKMPEQALSALDYIDVSFDGGPDTYGQRRRADFNAVVDNIKQARPHVGAINALHTLYAENIRDLADMMKVEDCFDFHTIAFSLYKVPHNHGFVRVSSGSLINQTLPALSENQSFMDSRRTRLLISRADITSGDPEQFFDKVEELGLKAKVHYCEDPLQLGFVRVTYDGRVLTPHDAIHPILYRTTGYSLNDPRFNTLNVIFSKLRQDNSEQAPLPQSL